jgi:hypothetical protein
MPGAVFEPMTSVLERVKTIRTLDWVTENRIIFMVVRIFGPKREEVEGSWRRLHNEELHNL